MSYAKAFKKAQCEGVETTVRTQHLLFERAVQRTKNERLTRRVMFETMSGAENPRPGRSENNWAQCQADDLKVFRATGGSTESSALFVVRSRDGVMVHGG